MKITEARLRQIIRSMLIEQDTGQTAAPPAADQAHKQLEATFKLDGSQQFCLSCKVGEISLDVCVPVPRVA